MKKTLLLLPLLAVAGGAALAAQPAFTLKDNDTWVMAGDSITAQRLHTSYIEAFFRTRYPQLHLHFRNSGEGGNTTFNILRRFDYDVAAWKPTIVSVELGMNDAYYPIAEYKVGMKRLIDQIRAINAEPLLISASAVYEGTATLAWVPERGRALHSFIEALKELGQTNNVRVVDQYHPLLALWEYNKTLDDANALAVRIRLLKPGNELPDLKILQAFAQSWEGQPAAVPLGGDGVHPSPAGQYTMAATILTALDVDREVSSATIKPNGTLLAARNCKITGLASQDGKLTFTRLDARSPWPLAPEAIAAAALMPEIADLSRYTLTVPGLPAGQYSVTMDGKPVATLSHQTLANGWNMSTLRNGPLGERADRINGLINELQGGLNTAWRDASKEKNQEKLAAAQKAIDENEVKLQAAVQPTPIHFEIAPVK